MQIVMKIAEEKRMNSAGMKALFNYIARESAVYKTIGIGVSDDSEKAFKQMMSNKRKYDKAIDDKYRFCYHEIITFEKGTDPELALKIGEDYCKNLHFEKGFNTWLGVQTDTENTHIHIVVDSTNFKNGKQLQSLTDKQLEKVPERQKLKEVYTYEMQRKFAEDMARNNGYEIEEEKTYKYMHEKKEKEGGKKWLTKNEYNTFKDKNSWRNVIKDKLEEIYKRIDVSEENIVDIAREYGLGISRHNKEKGTITFGLLNGNGEIESKKKIKLDRLMEQEQGSFTDPGENIFIYSNFFRDRSREKENVRQLEELLENEREKQIEKELVKVMEEKEKSIKAVANSLIKSKEKEYNRELEREREVEKLLESNHKDYKQDINKIVNLEQNFKDRQTEIPNLEINIKEYNKNKSLIEEDLPNKEKITDEKTNIADEKAKEVQRIKALLEQAEKDFYIANSEKLQAISEVNKSKNEINKLDNLIKSTTEKIADNKEKIISIPKQVAELKEGLKEKKNVIASNQEELKKVSNNVKIREQEYKEVRDIGMEKILEYESYIKSLYEKQLEAEEQKEREIAENYKKEIEKYQQDLINRNIEWDKINKLNADIREQVRLEREQKALAKKKELQEQRAKEEYQRKLELDLQEFIKLIDKGKIEDEDLIEMVFDLEEYEEIRNSNIVQYLMDIKSVLKMVNTDIVTEKFYGNTEEVKKCITNNEKLLERISKYMNSTNFEEEKELERIEKTKNKSISEEVIEDDFVIDKKGDFEYGR